MRRRTFFLCCIGALPALGCAHWKRPHDNGPLLPAARMAPDSVAFEVAFARQPGNEVERDHALWHETDEQSLSPQLRRNLAENGVRAGLLGTQIPAAVRQLLDAGNQPVDLQEGEAAGEGDFSYRSRRMHLRAGRRGKIVSSKSAATLPVLMRDDLGVRGYTLKDAQCILALRVFPQGDGRVRLEVTPEIEHGEVKSQWVGEEGTMVQKQNKEKITFDTLRVETLLAPGQTLLFGSTPEVKGVGEHFFSEKAGNGIVRRYLLVRLADTQLDDLFEPGRELATLATPGD